MRKSVKKWILVANDVRDCVGHAERPSDRQDDGPTFSIQKDRKFWTVVVAGILEPEFVLKTKKFNPQKVKKSSFN